MNRAFSKCGGRSKYLRAYVTPIALAALWAASANATADAGRKDSPGTIARATTLLKGDAFSGALPLTQSIHVEVALRLRNKEALDAYIVNAAKSQGRIPPMSHEQIMANHAPTPAQAQAVAAYLTSMGFRNVTVAPNRLLVAADGTAAAAGNAFLTSFARVRTSDGRFAFANTQDAHVPAALKDTVLGVVGLQNAYVPHAAVQRPAAEHTLANPRVGHFPSEFSSIYGGTGVATAAGVTVGVLTVQSAVGPAVTDLNTYTSTNSLAPVSTQTVNVSGSGASTVDPGSLQLQTQAILGVSGGQLGKFVFYAVPAMNDAALTAAMNAAVSANTAKVIVVGYSEPETTAQSDGSAAADDAILETAVAQGQTFAVAGGDSTASACPWGTTLPPQSWPASSQFVVSVSGTSLVATTTNWQNETAWVGCNGPSFFEPVPSWQSDSVSPATTRGVPDMAFDADPNSGAKVIVSGAIQQLGSTVLSSALFTGLWARALATRGTSLGFAGPQLYSLYQASDLHDFTFDGSIDGFSFDQGYDAYTGLGSLNLAKALRHLGTSFDHPPSTNFSFKTGYVNGVWAASFTDLSTDMDNNTLTYQWQFFGDQVEQSTEMDPVISIEAGVAVELWERVTDGSGVETTKYMQVDGAQFAPPPPQQLIVNSGFENAQPAPWVVSGHGVINNNSAESPHSGKWDAWLGGKGVAEADSIQQQVAIPSGYGKATLAFYLHVDTAETSTTQIKDHMIVRVLNASGATLAQLAEYSNLDAAAGYALHTFDLTPYLGQTIKVSFTGNENASLQTSFVLDDVTLTVQ